MGKENKHPQRKTLWVNHRFQTKFILLTLGSTLIIVLVGLLSNWVFVWKFIEFGNSRNLPPGDEYYRFIYKQEATLNLIFIASSSIIMIFSAIYGLVLSNKIAGPIYRIQKDLERLREGQSIDRIHVRKDDYFQELAVIINRILLDKKEEKEAKQATVPKIEEIKVE